jgi:hypothetical protein
MARRGEAAPAFCARLPDELTRSKPLNSGMSRLGGDPFHLTTKQYDRAADEGRRREMAEQSMMAEAEEKKRQKDEKKAVSREDRQAAKANKEAAKAEMAKQLEAQREEQALKKLEEELRKEDEIKAAKLKPKPGTQCIMRAVPKVVNLNDLKKMFENFGPVRSVKVIKLGMLAEDENAGVEGYEPILRAELVTVGVTFAEHWVARKALKSLGAKLEWNPCEDPAYTADTQADEPARGARRKARRRPSPTKSGRQSVPLKLPSVMSANQSLLVQAQREKAMNGDRPVTPLLNHSMLLNMSDDTMGVRDARISPGSYNTWRDWTSGAGGMVEHRHEMRKRGKALVGGLADQGLAAPGHESIAVLRKAWHTVDEDFSGYLDRGEVGQLIELLLGHSISHHGAARALKKMDDDDSGFVSFGEFEKWWRASEGGTADVHEHPDDHNPEAHVHFGGEPPKTPGPVKKRNCMLAAKLTLNPRHEISFETPDESKPLSHQLSI